ncbi:MAG: MBL fold metallo-hydrolase [Thermoplasmata archaeon]
MEIIKISGSTYIFPGSTAIGLYLEDNEATVIDTGIDENNIRKIFNYLKDKGIVINSVINTHSHADHIGGNAFLEKKGVENFYSSEIESFFIRNPEFLPGYMFGSNPPKFMQNKFLMAEKTKNVKSEIPKIFRVIDLSGHSWQMIGILTKDDVLFCADAFYAEDIVSKHPMLFHIDTENFFKKMDEILGMENYKKIISHGGMVNDVERVININKNAIENILNKTLDSLPNYLDLIYSSLSQDLNFNSSWEFYLNMVPFKSILLYLEKKGKIKFFLKEGKIYLDKI